MIYIYDKKQTTMPANVEIIILHATKRIYMDTTINNAKFYLKNSVSVSEYIFKNKTIAAKEDLIKKIETEWCQFEAVCDSLLTADEIRGFQNSMHYVIVISLRKHVLGYAIATELSLNDNTKSMLINSLCARSLPIKKQLIDICDKGARKHNCRSLHLEALLSDESVYKQLGFKRSEVQFACDETHNNEADANKFKVEIEKLKQAMGERGLLKDVERKLEKAGGQGTTKLARSRKELYKSFYSKQTLEAQIVLRGIIESGKVELSEVMAWTTKKDFKRMLTNVARQFKHKVPMAKCLRNVGVAGGGAGSGDSGGSQGGRASVDGGAGSGDSGGQGDRASKRARSDAHGGGGSSGGGFIDLTFSDDDDPNQKSGSSGDSGGQGSRESERARSDAHGGGRSSSGAIDLTESD